MLCMYRICMNDNYVYVYATAIFIINHRHVADISLSDSDYALMRK